MVYYQLAELALWIQVAISVACVSTTMFLSHQLVIYATKRGYVIRRLATLLIVWLVAGQVRVLADWMVSQALVIYLGAIGAYLVAHGLANISLAFESEGW